MSDILSLQRLPQIETLDLNPCNLAEADGQCSLCSYTCCCTAHAN